MSDLVSRQDAIEAFYNPENGGTYSEFDDGSEWYMTSKQIYAVLESLPSADRLTGKWIMHIDDLYPAESTQECSNCHKYETIFIQHDNYCPNCGAKMEGEE